MSEQISYATPMPAPSVHDTIYTTLLAVVTAFQLVGTIVMGFMMTRPSQPPEGVWIFHMVFAIEAMLFLFDVAVLLIRLILPHKRKWPTVALNIFLLLMFPWGTALGIYGLWKVDRVRTA